MKQPYSKPTVTASNAVAETLGDGIITSRIESFRTTRFAGLGFHL
jgi:hypothetical protein